MWALAACVPEAGAGRTVVFAAECWSSTLTQNPKTVSVQEQTTPASEQSRAARNSSVAGDLRLHEFQSRIFRNTRMLRVWLPPGYDDPENEGRHYPVFYLNDGQNLFDRATAFIGVEWQVDETA